MSEKWSVTGWQGIALGTPPDWSLVGFSGDETKGYFRVDSPSDAAVEVRWTVAQKPPTDLAANAERFLDSLRQAARKRKFSLSGRVKPRKLTPSEEIHGGSSVGFTWKSDKQAYGRLLYCGHCKRVVIAQVVCDVKRDRSGEASGILNSICEHSEPGWNVWGLYDLQVPIPETFRLRRHTLMSHYIELEFVSRNEKLIVERWGLAANTILKKQDLAAWIEGSFLPKIVGYKTRREHGTDDEPGIERLYGDRRGIHRALLSPIMGLMRKPMPRALTGCAWLCDKSNKVFVIRHYHAGGSDLAQSLRQKVAYNQNGASR